MRPSFIIRVGVLYRGFAHVGHSSVAVTVTALTATAGWPIASAALNALGGCCRR